MNVVYTFDEAFAEITGVSIISLLENCTDPTNVNIYIVDFGISDKGKEKLKVIAECYHCAMVFVNSIDVEKRIPVKLECSIWSTVCYERLFYAEVLPESIDKVLHLDCDTIIRKDITEIYETDISDVYCGACYDCSPKPKRQASINNKQPYISNGLILINLKKWREDNIGDKFVQCIVERKGNFPHLDQDIFNIVINQDVKILPAEFNMMPITIMYGGLCCGLFRRSEEYYSRAAVEAAKKNPAMIHFTGCRYTRRPWDQPCNHWYNGEWMSYYEKTPYYSAKTLIAQKKRRMLWLKQAFAKVWLVGSKLPGIRNILFYLDIKLVYRIN